MDENDAREAFVAGLPAQRNLGLAFAGVGAALILGGLILSSADEGWMMLFLLGGWLAWYGAVLLYRNGGVGRSRWDHATMVRYSVLSATSKSGGEDENDWVSLVLAEYSADHRGAATLSVDVRMATLATVFGSSSWVGEQVILVQTRDYGSKPRLMHRHRIFVIDEIRHLRQSNPPDAGQSPDRR